DIKGLIVGAQKELEMMIPVLKGVSEFFNLDLKDIFPSGGVESSGFDARRITEYALRSNPLFALPDEKISRFGIALIFGRNKTCCKYLARKTVP
ncbi:MAG: hypothetical protein SVS15_03055, partial [Thermodesulfobacteriota bacterium]|nr:hypothetical protein [Thermodesulfobacteriota bacterium]